MQTAYDVAQWMMDHVTKYSELDQVTAAEQISFTFGKDFTYENENGNLAIHKSVLTAFRKLSGDTVVWDRSYRTWRKRQSFDAPGRQQE